MLTFLSSFLLPISFMFHACIFSKLQTPRDEFCIFFTPNCSPQQGAKEKVTEDMPNHSVSLCDMQSIIRETFLDCQGRGQNLVDDNFMME